MKNIFILPTDKPSRLYYHNDNLLRLISDNILFTTSQHIYITSDEEIKEGNWFIYKDEVIHRDKGKIDSMWIDAVKNGKKIILTTDLKLIKDGVQAIDDEFLQWFVKNPNCEEVEVESNKCLVKRGQCSCSYQDIDCQCSGYKIITPKEESKCHGNIQDCLKLICDCQSKQETPEEETLSKIKFVLSCGNDSQAIKLLEQYSEWKVEKMYTEENIKLAVYLALNYNPSETNIASVSEYVIDKLKKK